MTEHNSPATRHYTSTVVMEDGTVERREFDGPPLTLERLAALTPAPNTLEAHTGHRIVRHSARWSACPGCNQWIDTRACTHDVELGELAPGLVESGAPAPCARCGVEVVQW